MILYKIVKTREDRKLFAEMYQKYLAYLSVLGHDIVTNPKLPFIDKELEKINHSFRCQIIALSNNIPVGCIALEKWEDSICEMKRMFVMPAYRGKGIGKELACLIIGEAKKMGFQSMRLSTLNILKEAQHIYYSLGFKKINPYYEDNINDFICMELKF